MDDNLKKLITDIPKTELHLHIEGTFEPELMFEIAKRNGVELKYKSVDDLKKAYSFNNLQEFLDIYYAGASVLLKEQDFYDLTYAYLKRISADNVVHTEIFFDPQTHTDRGVAFETVINGIKKALDDGLKNLGISSEIIVSFLRHLSEDEAIKIFNQALPYKDWIIGVGLDSSELGHPPSKFKKVFEMARNEGFKAVAHAGEEGPVEYIWEAINLLKIDRVDHGNRCLDDPKLVNYLIENNMALTICPLSNLSLKVINDLKKHPVKSMLDAGMAITINSDDPAYFGGYINANYLALADAIKLSKQEIINLAKNSFTASFLSDNEKDAWIKKLESF